MQYYAVGFFLPFIVGGLLKSALGAATLKLFSTYRAEPRDRSSETQ